MSKSSSPYVLNERKGYSLYVLTSRAIPHITDGLKTSARRILWKAKHANKVKSSALAGSCADIHPHAAPENAINTIAAPYGNNCPLLKGYGAFGTLLKPTAYGASRYTSVAVSQFTKDVIFRDIELIPMVDNYDGTLQEPRHFLPLIPVAVLNPQEGIAVGFASNILPRALENIISSQIQHLSNKKVTEATPSFAPLNQIAHHTVLDRLQNSRWVFRGEYKKVNATVITITNLPYGISHAKFIDKLEKIEDDGRIISITDNSSDSYDITLKFKKGVLSKLDNEGIYQLLGLDIPLSENLNVVDFDGSTIWSTNYTDLIIDFTDWRLSYYRIRYKRLSDLIKIDIQKLQDILIAIKKDVGGVARKIQSKDELKEYLSALKIVNVDYIADLPVYRFTEDERIKAENKLNEKKDKLAEYTTLIKSEKARKQVYISELKEISQKSKSNQYIPSE